VKGKTEPVYRAREFVGTLLGWEPDRFVYRVGPVPPGTGRTGPIPTGFANPGSRRRCRRSRRRRSLGSGPLVTHSSRSHSTAAPILAVPAPVHKRSSIFPARRGGGALHSSLFFSPSPPRSAVEQRIGENPKWLVGSPQGFGLGVKTLSQGSPRAKNRRRTLVGGRAEGSDVVSWLWMATAPLA
jgi:hypothetical protein